MPHVVGSVEVYEQQTSAADSGKQPGCGAVGMNPLNTLKIARAVPMSKGWNTSIS